MDKEVGERIRHVRLDKGYTRDTLSMMSGVSEKYIFQIERQHTLLGRHIVKTDQSTGFIL